jgi:hypothetical protein
MKLMSLTRTDNAVIAQMVRDAIMNDNRKKDDAKFSIYERASEWYERMKKLKECGRFYYSSIADLPLGEFLCAYESCLGILDFWDGDIVDVWVNGDVTKKATGVVKEIGVNPTIKGGGYAKVLFMNGETETYSWKYIFHSEIPQELVNIAKTQFMATHACPLMKENDENKEN